MQDRSVSILHESLQLLFEASQLEVECYSGKGREVSQFVSATMTSDNNLLLSISVDEDVAYTTLKTPSYCTSTDIEERMMLTKSKPAVTSHSPQAHLPLSILCASMPIFKFSPCNNTPQNFKTAFCTDAVM